MNKKLAVFIVLLFTCIFLTSFLLLHTDSKILSSLGKDYHVNTMRVDCPLDQMETCAGWEGKDGVEAVVYDYATGGSYQDDKEVKVGESASIDMPYWRSLTSVTLPMKEEVFNLHDHIAFGTYIKDKQDVMLGYQLADDIALTYATDLEGLVGKTIEIETAHGQEKFRVSGIFQPYSEQEETYLTLLGKDVPTANVSYYFSEAYAADYMFDTQLGAMEKGENAKSAFTFYFSSYGEALAFENQYADSTSLMITSYAQVFSRTIEQFQAYSVILMPILFLVLLVIIAFHLFIQGVQMKYEKHILSVYQYCGYSMREIKKATLEYYIVEMSVLSLIAFLLSILLGYVVNYANTIVHFMAFPLFQVSLSSALFIFISVLVFGCLFLSYQFHQMKTISWYDLLRSRRDFL